MEEIIATVVGIFGGFAYVGAAIAIFIAVRHSAPVIERILFAGLWCGMIFCLLYLLYFIVSWLPLELDACYGTFQCSSVGLLKDIVTTRWNSAVAVVVTFCMTGMCYWFLVRRAKNSQATQ